MQGLENSTLFFKSQFKFKFSSDAKYKNTINFEVWSDRGSQPPYQQKNISKYGKYIERVRLNHQT